jgi:hypothetical protein
LSDLADQGLDSLVFLNPLAHLREEILGDIDGSGFAFFLEGEEKAGMAWTGETMTAGTSAFFLNGDQTGGEQGSFGLEMFDAGLELLLDEGGVFGRFHIHRRIAESRLGITDKYKDLSEMARKSSGAKKEFFDEERGNLRTGDYRLEMRDFRRQIEVRKIDCSSELVQHVLTTLKPGGRAAIVLPDNCLFGERRARSSRFSCRIATCTRLLGRG